MLLFFRDNDLNHPFLSASWPWFSLVRVVLDSQYDSSSCVKVPVDLDSLEGRHGLGLPLGVDSLLRWLNSSWNIKPLFSSALNHKFNQLSNNFQTNDFNSSDPWSEKKGFIFYEVKCREVPIKSNKWQKIVICFVCWGSVIKSGNESCKNEYKLVINLWQGFGSNVGGCICEDAQGWVFAILSLRTEQLERE